MAAIQRVSPSPEKGSLRRQVMTLAWPAVIENLLVMSVGIADTAMVGLLGAAYLAGVELANRLVNLGVAIFAAVLIGTTALVARSTGANDKKTANEAMRQALVLVFLIGVPLLFLGTLYAERCVTFMMVMQESPDPAVIEAGTIYLRITIPFLLFALLMMTINSCLRGAGDTRTPMVITGVSNVINIVGNYILIYGAGPIPAMGVAGAAWATNIARLAGAILVFRAVYGERGALSLRFNERFRFDPEIVRRIVRVGIPAAVEQGLMRSAQLVYGMIVAGLDTVSIAAHAVALTAESISFMPGAGFSLAATTLVGQSLGAGDPDRAEQSGYESGKMATLVMSAMGILFFVFPRFFVGLFSRDPEVIDLAAQCLRIVAISQPALAWVMTLAGGLRGVGDTRWVMLITVLGFWGVRVTIAYILATTTDLGLIGAWIAMILDLFVRALLLAWRFRQGGWKEIDV
ncbi:MAG: MATE family efflux transporter [Firmicutes bacterium]|nr:MATE family efflux transporter [Bacillota bacterium]